MADWGSAVVDRLGDDDALTAAVGPRVDWTKSPPETAEPRIVLSTISDPRPDHFGGEQGLRETRLQLDVYSRVSAAEATSIAELAIAVLKPEASRSGVRFDRAGVDGPVDGGEQQDALYLFRSRVDFLLWHAEEGV